MKKLLIAYYSHSGNTEELAELIRTETGGVLFEIKPATPYPSAYQAVVGQAKEEIRAGFRPEIRETADVDPYDVVFVGSPNWWSTIAPPVASFLERCGLTGKTVVPFCTHGGGGMAGLARDTRALCPSSEVMDGFAVYGNSVRRARDEVDAWLRKIGLKEQG